MVRTRSSIGKAAFTLTTVKNTPDKSFASGGSGFATWLNANVSCTNAADMNTCSYQTADAQLSARIVNGTKTVSLLGATSPVDFDWFPGSTNVKQRFAALNTCSGCHMGETGTGFLHVDSFSGDPSAFLAQELVSRLRSFKNLVCLATATTSGLNLSNSSANFEDLRIETSRWTH